MCQGVFAANPRGRYARAAVSATDATASVARVTATLEDREALHARYEAAFDGATPPFAFLELDAGLSGILAFTLPEALFLAREGFEDIVVAYPTADREALAELVELAATDPAHAPVPMVDSSPHLDLIEGDRIVDQVATYRGEGKAFL